MSRTDSIVQLLRGAAFDFDAPMLADVIWAAQHLPYSTKHRVDSTAATVSPIRNRRERVTAKRDAEILPVKGVATPHAPRPATSVGAEPARSGYVPIYAPTSPDFAEGIPVSPVRMPAGFALPNGLDIVRSLRSIPARRASRTALELDVEATVEATARNNGQFTTVLRPSADRWFEVVIVVERTPSAEIWSDTVVELERLLQYAGVFRDVRVLWLDLQGEPVLRLRGGENALPHTLSDPGGRRIILFFSPGISQEWANGTIGSVLGAWSRLMPVALVHALPQTMWQGSILGRPPLLVDTTAVGAPNHLLRLRPAWWARKLPLDLTRLALPVFALEGVSARRWSEMIACRRGTVAPAFLVMSRARVAQDREAIRLADDRDPTSTVDLRGDRDRSRSIERVKNAERRLQHLAISSARAYRLAVLLGSSPFTLPLVRLVHAALYGRSADNTPIVEMMLCGLVVKVQSRALRHPSFRFEDAASEVLLRGLRRDDVRELSEILDRHLAQSIELEPESEVYIVNSAGSEIMAADAQPFAELRRALDARLTSAEAPPSLKPIHAPKRVIDPRLVSGEVLIGREEDVRIISRDLGRKRLIVIIGFPGIGKTAVACAVAAANIDQYDVIWRIDGRNETTIRASLRVLRDNLGLPPREIEREPVALIRAIVGELSAVKLRVLLVADDVSATWAKHVIAISRTVSVNVPLSVLITTRASRHELPTVVSVVRVEPLTRADAISYLKREGIDSKVQAAIITATRGIPSALHFAVAALHRPSVQAFDYIRRLASRRKSKTDVSRGNPVTAAFLELLQIAEGETPGLVAVLAMSSFLANDIVPLHFLRRPPRNVVWEDPYRSLHIRTAATRRDGTEPGSVDLALKTMQEFGLLVAQSEGTVRVPQTIGDITRHMLDEISSAWRWSAVQTVYASIMDSDGDNVPSDILSSALFVLEHRISRRAAVAGYYETAARLAIECASISEVSFDVESVMTFLGHARDNLTRITSGRISAPLWSRIADLYSEVGAIEAAGNARMRVAALTPLKGDANGFLSEVAVTDMARKYLETVEPVSILKLFETGRQRTWLVVASGHVACLLDDAKTRAANLVPQWKLRLKDIGSIRTRLYSNQAGLVDIGPHKSWLYSYKLFPNRDNLLDAIYEVAGISRPVPLTPRRTLGAKKKALPRKAVKKSTQRTLLKKSSRKKAAKKSGRKITVKKSGTKKSGAKKSPRRKK